MSLGQERLGAPGGSLSALAADGRGYLRVFLPALVRPWWTRSLAGWVSVSPLFPQDAQNFELINLLWHGCSRVFANFGADDAMLDCGRIWAD